jgi:RNA polymerase sigma-70 factor (ECF subfamily)
MQPTSNLISDIKKGNRQAYTLMYNRYKTDWFRICLRYNQNRADASDALQNGLIKIFQKINQFDDSRGSFTSWSNRIIVNESLMLIRKKTNVFITDSVREEVDVWDQSETPIEKLSAEELTDLIQKLPGGYRAVFNLYVIDGYTHAEIADKLTISVGTSKSQLFKARKMIQERLEELLSMENVYGR